MRQTPQCGVVELLVLALVSSSQIETANWSLMTRSLVDSSRLFSRGTNSAV